MTSQQQPRGTAASFNTANTQYEKLLAKKNRLCSNRPSRRRDRQIAKIDAQLNVLLNRLAWHGARIGDNGKASNLIRRHDGYVTDLRM